MAKVYGVSPFLVSKSMPGTGAAALASRLRAQCAAQAEKPRSLDAPSQHLIAFFDIAAGQPKTISMWSKTTVLCSPLDLSQIPRAPCIRPCAGRYHGFSSLKGSAMKTSLNVKIVILLGYVVLCTVLVLVNQQADAPVAVPLALNVG